MNIAIEIFILLHGLVHLWYVTLSQGWVEFQADMGWTGKSWLLSNFMDSRLTRGLATALYGLAAILYLIAGAGLIARQNWTQPWLVGASVASILAILLFWDGNFSLIVQKGLLGLLISAGILAAVLVFNWAAV